MLNNINKLKDAIMSLIKIKRRKPFKITFDNDQFKLEIFKSFFKCIIHLTINGNGYKLEFTELWGYDIVLSKNQSDQYINIINNKLNNDLLFDEINKYIEQLILEEI
jgi:hypothetical protein